MSYVILDARKMFFESLGLGDTWIFSGQEGKQQTRRVVGTHWNVVGNGVG